MPWKAVETLLDLNALAQLTEHTIVDPSGLRNHLNGVRKNGYAIDNQENEMGIRCVAAPVFDGSDSVVAAISLSGPAARINLNQIKSSLNKSVRETALNVSTNLGYKGGGKITVTDPTP
jgi:DNA-binding IclR family transcriptional regulator